MPLHVSVVIVDGWCVAVSYLMTTASCTFLKLSKLSKPRIRLCCLQLRILQDIMVVARSVSLYILHTYFSFEVPFVAQFTALVDGIIDVATRTIVF